MQPRWKQRAEAWKRHADERREKRAELRDRQLHQQMNDIVALVGPELFSAVYASYRLGEPLDVFEMFPQAAQGNA